jgi:hypothetical protein
MHFVTPMVPSPRTDHSLMHNSTRGMSPGQKGLQVRFRENVRFGPFSWVIAHDFQHGVNFFQHSGCAQTPCRRHLARFSFIFGLWGTCFGPFSVCLGAFRTFSVCLGAFRTENYLLKRKSE